MLGVNHWNWILAVWMKHNRTMSNERGTSSSSTIWTNTAFFPFHGYNGISREKEMSTIKCLQKLLLKRHASLELLNKKALAEVILSSLRNVAFLYNYSNESYKVMKKQKGRGHRPRTFTFGWLGVFHWNWILSVWMKHNRTICNERGTSSSSTIWTNTAFFPFQHL